MEPTLPEARAEITLKFSELPQPRKLDDDARRVELRFSAAPFIFVARVTNRAFNRAAKAIQEFEAWAGALSGKMGSANGREIELLEAGLQIFSKIPKPASGAPEQANPSS